MTTSSETTAQVVRPSALGKLSLLLAMLFVAAYLPFVQDPVSHNTLCRAAMTANMVQHGRIDINGYEDFTRDKAVRDGVYYCDKAPGMSFLAMPAALAFTTVMPVTPESAYTRTWTLFLYISGLTTAAALCAVAGVLLFRHIVARTGNVTAGLIAAIAFGLGTPIWGWATSFFSHAATAAMLVMGYIAMDAAVRRLPDGNRRFLPALLAGLAFGGATAIEYTSFVPALIIGAALAAACSWKRPLDVITTYLVCGLGAVVPLIPVFIFHALAFGSPLTAGYAYTAEFDMHRTGLFGIGIPDPAVIIQLIFSGHRGLVWYAPVILAMVWAIVRMIRTPGLRPAGVGVALVVAWYFLMNAGFAYWEGGVSTGPRYLTPAAGFAAIALGLAWPMFAGWERRATVGLVVISIVINFAATAVGMTEGDLVTKIAPGLFTGDLRHTLSVLMLGSSGLVHFVFPLAIIGAAGWLLYREYRRLTASDARPE